MRRRLGTFIAVTFLLIGGMAAGFNRPVAAQDPAGVSAQITAPTDGARLFGLVTITGSAAHPTAFSAYTLEYKDLREPAAPWFLVQERVTQQVQDGVLGAWNTIMVPDGFTTAAARLSRRRSGRGVHRRQSAGCQQPADPCADRRFGPIGRRCVTTHARSFAHLAHRTAA